MDSRIENVTKSNELITASYSLTTREQRLLLAAISLCNPQKEIPAEIKITADYYSSIFESSNPYRDMRLAAKGLFDRSVFVKSESEEGEIRWLAEKWQSRREDVGGGYVRLVFTDALKKYLSSLTGYFSSYEVRRVGRFKSAYAFRIFEMLMMFKKNGWLRISVDDLRSRLDLPESYSSVTNMRKHVLDIALAEINRFASLTVNYEVIYKARRAVAFDFTFFGEGVGEKPTSKQEPEQGAPIEVVEKTAEPKGQTPSTAEDQAEESAVVSTDDPESESVADNQGEPAAGSSKEAYQTHIIKMRSTLRMKQPADEK